MNCANHPNMPNVAYCRTCGKPLCAGCQRDVQGVIYCENCLAERLHGVHPPGGGSPPSSRSESGTGGSNRPRYRPESCAGWDSLHIPRCGHGLCRAVRQGSRVHGDFCISDPGNHSHQWTGIRFGAGFLLCLPDDRRGAHRQSHSDGTTNSRSLRARPNLRHRGTHLPGGSGSNRCDQREHQSSQDTHGRGDSDRPGRFVSVANGGIPRGIQRGSFVWPLILIAVGVWLLAKREGWISSRSRRDGRPYRKSSLMGPAVLVTIGSLFLIESLDGPSFGRTWPVLLLAIGLVKLSGRQEPATASLTTNINPACDRCLQCSADGRSFATFK